MCTYFIKDPIVYEVVNLSAFLCVAKAGYEKKNLVVVFQESLYLHLKIVGDDHRA